MQLRGQALILAFSLSMASINVAHAAQEPTNPESAGAVASAPSAAEATLIKELKLEKKMARLSKAMSRSSRKPLLRRLAVRGDGIDTTDFEHKGSELYVAYVTLAGGKQLVEINGKDYDLDNATGEAEYVMLFNNSKPARPKLTVFKKDLLQWVTSPI
ncbi:hypothetical protein [Halioxenophilus aromaticivorans]|uniref:Uncharacterized protein n=1 Tax=Halioxenophilus aromaticivorans TaxID=1306992 RepID=A0AAV3TX58_9ALTE